MTKWIKERIGPDLEEIKALIDDRVMENLDSLIPVCTIFDLLSLGFSTSLRCTNN